VSSSPLRAARRVLSPSILCLLSVPPRSSSLRVYHVAPLYSITAPTFSRASANKFGGALPVFFGKLSKLLRLEVKESHLVDVGAAATFPNMCKQQFGGWSAGNDGERDCCLERDCMSVLDVSANEFAGTRLTAQEQTMAPEGRFCSYCLMWFSTYADEKCSIAGLSDSTERAKAIPPECITNDGRHLANSATLCEPLRSLFCGKGNIIRRHEEGENRTAANGDEDKLASDCVCHPCSSANKKVCEALETNAACRNSVRAELYLTQQP